MTGRNRAERREAVAAAGLVALLIGMSAPAGAQTWQAAEEKLGPFPAARHTVFPSGDCRHVGYVATSAGAARVVVDGVPGPAYGDILPGGVGGSYDLGRLVYAVQKDSLKWRLADGDTLGPEYEKILAGCLCVAPDGKHLLYVARRAGQWVAVFDGQEEAQTFDEFHPRSVCLSPDGRRRAYAAKRGDKWFVVIDGQVSGPYGWIHPPIFSADSQHVVFAAAPARRKAFVVLDGKPGPTYENIGGLVGEPITGRATTDSPLRLSSNGDLLYTAYANNEWFAVHNGKEGPGLNPISPRLAISPDGRRAIYYGQAARGGSYAYVDGKPGPACLSTRLDPVFSPDSKRYGYLAYRTRNDGEWFEFVIDGQPGVPLQDWASGPVFSADSQHVAYAGLAAGSVVLYRDGQAQPGCEGTNIGLRSFSPDNRHLAWVMEDRAAPPVRVRFALDGQPQPWYADAVGGHHFQPDGTFVYFGIRDDTLYRVRATLAAPAP